MRFKFFVLSALLAGAVHAAGPHKVVIQVNEADPERLELALNNVANINKYYQDRGEEVMVEVVAYGPGLTMLVDGKSPVAERVVSISQNFEKVSFRACGNTHAKMSQKAGKKVALMPQAQMVDAGVIHLMQRQQEGWSYIRP
jgi:intracellular sulfur oxidation DsrE/DsrF family protein